MKSTTKIANLKTEFSMRNATNFAGSKVILAFLESIGLIHGLQTLGLPKASNALFPTHRVLQYLIIGWLLGCERLFHFKSLQQDALIRHALGGRLPHHTLLNKIVFTHLGRGNEKAMLLSTPILLQLLLRKPSLPLQKSVNDFFLMNWRKIRNILRRVEQSHQTKDSIQY